MGGSIEAINVCDCSGWCGDRDHCHSRSSADRNRVACRRIFTGRHEFAAREYAGGAGSEEDGDEAKARTAGCSRDQRAAADHRARDERGTAADAGRAAVVLSGQR